MQKAVRYIASGSEESVSSTVAGGGEAHKGYGSTAAKQGQLMESKTSGSARKVQKSDERWPALWPNWNDNVVVIISWGTTRTAGTKKRAQYQHQANKREKRRERRRVGGVDEVHNWLCCCAYYPVLLRNWKVRLLHVCTCTPVPQCTLHNVACSVSLLECESVRV